MRRLEFAPEAERDIDALLIASENRFGPAAADRYRALLDAVFTDLCRDPQRPAARPREGLSGDLRFYHLKHAAKRLPARNRVSRARHLIVFRFDAERVEVVRVLHESMDLARHLLGDEP